MKSIKQNNKKIHTILGITAATGICFSLTNPVLFADNSLGSDGSNSFGSTNSQQSLNSFKSEGSQQSLRKATPNTQRNKQLAATIETITDGLGDASGVALDNLGSVYVSDAGPVGVGTPSNLYKVNLATGTKELITDQLPKYSGNVILDLQARNIYLSNSNAVYRVNLASKQIDHITCGMDVGLGCYGTPQKVLLDSSGTKLYVNVYTGVGYGTVAASGITPNSVATNLVDLGYDPNGIFNLAGNKLYTGDSKSGKIEEINIDNPSVRRTILTDSKYAYTMASSLDKLGNLYVAYTPGISRGEFNQLRKNKNVTAESTVIDKINLSTGTVETVASYNNVVMDMKVTPDNMLIASTFDGKLLRIKF